MPGWEGYIVHWSSFPLSGRGDHLMFTSFLHLWSQCTWTELGTKSLDTVGKLLKTWAPVLALQPSGPKATPLHLSGPQTVHMWRAWGHWSFWLEHQWGGGVNTNWLRLMGRLNRKHLHCHSNACSLPKPFISCSVSGALPPKLSTYWSSENEQ